MSAAAVRHLTAAEADRACAAAEAEGWSVGRVDCSTGEALARTLDTALDWQRLLGFAPQGLNLDALYDALCHAPNPQRPRLLLRFDAVDALAARDPRRARGLPEVLAQRANEIQGSGLGLMAVLVPPETPSAKG